MFVIVVGFLSLSLSHTHTHTHTHIYIYIYIYISVDLYKVSLIGHAAPVGGKRNACRILVGRPEEQR